MKAIAFCGLACCVCSENKGCVGCQDGGCESHGWCKNYNCCKEKGLNGCWECSEFPFTGCMLDKPRIRAFAKFARRYGVEELEKCLLRNKEISCSVCRVTVVMIVQSVLPILQRKPIMKICADRLRAFIKRVLDLTFLLKNSTATVADQRTCLSCARSVPSKSVV